MNRCRMYIPAAFLVILMILVTCFALPTAVLAEEDEEIEEITATTKFPVLSAEGDSRMTFEIELKYEGGDEKRQFDLVAEVPEGFSYYFEPKVSGKPHIEAVVLDPRGMSQSIKLSVIPDRPMIEPGEYPVNFAVVSGDLSASLDLTAVVTKVFDMVVSTPTGRLNAQAAAGEESSFTVVVRNLSSDDINKIEMINTAGRRPAGWEVSFEPKEIEALPPGGEQEIQVTMKLPEKTISGDYDITVRADSKEIDENVEIRVTVRSSTLWQGVGLGIVFIVILFLAVVFLRFIRKEAD